MYLLHTNWSLVQDYWGSQCDKYCGYLSKVNNTTPDFWTISGLIWNSSLCNHSICVFKPVQKMQGKVQVVQVSDDTLGWFWGLDHRSKGGGAQGLLVGKLTWKPGRLQQLQCRFPPTLSGEDRGRRPSYPPFGWKFSGWNEKLGET